MHLPPRMRPHARPLSPGAEEGQARGHLRPDAIIFHSDRETQATSREMGAWCAWNNVGINGSHRVC